MTDSTDESDPRTGDQQEPLGIAESNIPDTDGDWFALIESEIDVLPKEADEDDAIELAQHHAEQAVERTGMAVNLNRVEWRVTRELRTKHGYHRGGFIKLSMDSLETNGWQEFLRVVRHELVHVWQYQNDVDDRPAKNTFERFHGSSFEQWMPILNVDKHGPHILPLWTIECSNCQAVLDGKRRARDKEIAQRIQTLDVNVCHECGHELSEYTIKRDGEEIPSDSLPDVLTDEQDQVFLYHEPSTTAQPPKREWNPQTQRLTAFTGIAEETARTLGRTINCIDGLLDADNETLSAEVRSAVPGSYHESLRAEVCDLYENALAHRSTDDIELLNQVMSSRNYDWWKPVECLDGTGTVESMCLLLRDDIEPDDRLRITVENHGEYTAQVVETTGVEMPTLGVTIDPDSTPLGSQGVIEIPDPHRGEYPTFQYKQDPPESEPTINMNSSGSAYVIRRENIIEVEKQASGHW
jgi:predicted SprT family Zn-dependent metalloprotease